MTEQMKSRFSLPISYLLCILIPTLSACSSPLSSISTPSPAQAAVLPAATTSVPQPTHTLPASTSTSTFTPQPTPTMTSTSTPMPTPTPPPLPEVCLKQKFIEDIEACHEVPQYDIDLTVQLEPPQVTGSQQITYTNAEDVPLDHLYLRLFPNSRGYGGTMTMTHVLLNGNPVTPQFELQNTAARIPLETALDPGEVVTLSMDFTVGVPTSPTSAYALFSYLRGVMALPTFYPIIPVYDDQGWDVEHAPDHSDDLHTDIARHRVRISAPADLTLVASGTCTNPEPGKWICQAAPMRDFTLILGEDYQRAAREVEGVVVNSYFYTGHAEGGGRALQVAVDSMSVFSELFGPYPYTELDVVETPNRLGGMEYSGLVVVEDGLYAEGGVEWLTVHEVAHQWWMVVVGNDQVDEPWLDEALTQYSTMLYYEKVYGRDRARAILQQEFEGSYQSVLRQGRDMPAGLPSDAYPPDLYWKIVYDKGALYFHALREAVGDEAFFEILQTYYQRHRYEIATPEMFLDAIETVTGDQHRDIYEKWIGEDAD